jgi:hypothetical protein
MEGKIGNGNIPSNCETNKSHEIVTLWPSACNPRYG